MQSEKVFNQDLYFKKTVKYVGEPMTHLESIASSAVLLPIPALSLHKPISLQYSVLFSLSSSLYFFVSISVTF